MPQHDVNSIETAQRLYAAILGNPTHLTQASADLLKALKDGATPILVELPWGEVRDGERIERHQVVLMRADKGRVFFANGLKSGQPAGTQLTNGPNRRVEPAGEESMDLNEFVALFKNGGKAMLKDQA